MTERSVMNAEQMRAWLHQHVPLEEFRGRRVLLIVPDNTRTAPLPVLFPELRQIFADSVGEGDRPIPSRSNQSIACSEVKNSSFPWLHPSRVR